LNTQVIVQLTGIQWALYKIMKTAQNYVPMGYTNEAVSILKTTSITGSRIIK